MENRSIDSWYKGYLYALICCLAVAATHSAATSPTPITKAFIRLRAAGVLQGIIAACLEISKICLVLV